MLEEAWFLYRFPNTDFAIRGGQMHDPLDHENIVGSKIRYPEASLQGDIMGNTDTFTKMFAIEYNNYANYYFYNPGVSDAKPLCVVAGINDGIRSADSDFRESTQADHFYDWVAAGRVEYKVFGHWKNYNEMTARSVKDDPLGLRHGR